MLSFVGCVCAFVSISLVVLVTIRCLVITVEEILPILNSCKEIVGDKYQRFRGFGEGTALTENMENIYIDI
jgi:hypothetical protein